MLEILLPVAGIIVGAILSYFLVKPKSKQLQELAEKDAERTRNAAEKDAKRMIEEARRQAQEMKQTIRTEAEQNQKRFDDLQKKADERMARREETLDARLEKTENAREKYESAKRELEEKKREIQNRLNEQNEELEKISALSKEEAKNLLLERIEEEISPQLAEVMERRVELMRQHADEDAANILVQAIQRYSSATTAETTVTIVKIESDALKGKIIGREGRNINAFEALTGVDVIIDDTPGTITLSSFDTFRRYVAKIALEELLKDGRIHPSSIEESIKKAESSAEKLLLDLGKKAAQELGITGFPEQILRLIGRLRFRSSYGQNVLSHSLEVAWLAEAIAQEVPGADPEVCKRAGLVHDIGKAVSHEVEGGHAVIGMEILEKFGIDPAIVVAMKSHHEDFPYESIEARVLQAADAISASRPGARRETLEKYIKRLKELESIASSFAGVQKVFAIQAGREVRVFVNAAQVNDLESEKLSFEIARKIEKNCQYPGEVRVSVHRESKFEDTAK
ncbi:ribonuclease Y [bacterium DOLZORAL124_38_8]|nr:MAG: ribonuclease Y [bacterium DOLZORAL124_38_8]